MRFIKALTEKAATLSGPARKAMDHKIAVLKKMVAFSRTVPDNWSEHEKLADTPQGWAVHAMVLDIDVGPHAADPQAPDLGASSRAPRATPGR